MNKVILMGRLTKDPELKYTQTDIAVCSFTLAVDRKSSKENQTDFIPIVAWRKTAEFCASYFTKGLKVVVIGNMQVRNWNDKEGNKRYTTEVIADEVEFAESKKVSGEIEGNNPDFIQNDVSEDPPF